MVESLKELLCLIQLRLLLLCAAAHIHPPAIGRRVGETSHSTAENQLGRATTCFTGGE